MSSIPRHRIFRKHPGSGNGFVYFVAPEAALCRPIDSEGAVVKIGFTRGDPAQRLKALQTGSPLALRLWAYFEGTEETEKAFHEAFAELRFMGEWFFLQGKLRDFLRYLGDEPNIGNLISREDVGIAVFDNIFCQYPPHPDTNENDWNASARHEVLAGHFPQEWEDFLT